MKLAFLVSLVLGLVTLVYSQDECPCSLEHTVVSGSGGKYYDTCTVAGTFKSKSICYKDTRVTPNKLVPPYQFYTCVPYGSSFILYPRNCSGPLTVYEDTTADLDNKHFIWNAYNENNGLCDQANPSEVTDPGLAMDPPTPTVGWPFCPPPGEN